MFICYCLAPSLEGLDSDGNEVSTVVDQGTDDLFSELGKKLFSTKLALLDGRIAFALQSSGGDLFLGSESKVLGIESKSASFTVVVRVVFDGGDGEVGVVLVNF